MIAVILTARTSWTKLEPVCRALKARQADFGIIACASALLERYGRVVELVRRQGYPVVAECYSTYEGATHLTTAKETGALLTELCTVLRLLSATQIVVCADRHEVLAAATAASYLYLPLVHLQGGERTGSIDDKVRDAVTHLADQHCVSTEVARGRTYGLTGNWERIYRTGCSSLDLACEALGDAPVMTTDELGGVGPTLDLQHPFLLILQHPVTQESEDAARQMEITLTACRDVSLPQLYFWPSHDAGSDATAKIIRVSRETHPTQAFHAVRNVPPRQFLRLLTQSAVLVGNSSVGIREGSFLGAPVVNIGTRQIGRERAGNVIDVPHDVDAIRAAINKQRHHGPYTTSALYGDGAAGPRIAEVVCGLPGVQSELKSLSI